MTGYSYQNSGQIQRVKEINAWIPPENAIPFLHTSINACNEMHAHNFIYDYDAIFTGIEGSGTDVLANISTHQFNTCWRADSAVEYEDQYFEFVLSAPKLCDSYIMNFCVPLEYNTSPYTPDASCWESWIFSGRLNSDDEWIVLETVTSNDIKFYKGIFIPGIYKYFKVDTIVAYSDIAQDNRIDAYIYTIGLYDSITKYIDIFPDPNRGINDVLIYPESMTFLAHDIYIEDIHYHMGDVDSLEGCITSTFKGADFENYMHLGEVLTDYNIVTPIITPSILHCDRLNSVDFTENSGICLYVFPPPNEIWWVISSGYAFDETSANINTPIYLKTPDNTHKLSPNYTITGTYDKFSVFGAKFETIRSGSFKVNKYYVAFNDPINMESQIKFNGQVGEGFIVDMDGTSLTCAADANCGVTIARLKIGDSWNGYNIAIHFNPPLKLDGDVQTDLFKVSMEKILGSVLSFSINGFKVPK